MNVFRTIRTDPAEQTGFTLVELLVSMSIFTFVSTAAVGSLLVMIDANRKAQQTQTTMSNLSFALDSMTRDIRTGTDYYCTNGFGNLPPSGSNQTSDCNNGARGFSFNEGGSSLTGAPGCSGSRISYYLDNSTGRIQRRLCTGSWQDLTSSDLTIDTLRFYTTGAHPSNPPSGSSDDEAPTVTIIIKGSINDTGGAGDTEVAIQTTVTQRLLDI